MNCFLWYSLFTRYSLYTYYNKNLYIPFFLECFPSIYSPSIETKSSSSSSSTLTGPFYSSSTTILKSPEHLYKYEKLVKRQLSVVPDIGNT